MKVMQADLIRADNSAITTTAWIECRPKLKEGVRIRLKGYDADESVWWVVKTLYTGKVRESTEIDTDWGF